MDNAIKAIYLRVFPAVARHVSRRGGTFEEAKDVFHDALMIYYEKKYDGSLALQQGEGGYIFGIARHLWTKRYAENQRFVPLDQLIAGFDSTGTGPEWASDSFPEENRSDQRIMKVLQAAGKRCMEMLTSFYYEKLGMEELAARFGFSGVRSAAVQKFKCLQKVKDVVKEKSLRYEDFVK